MIEVSKCSVKPDNFIGLGFFRVLLALSVVMAHSGLIFGHNIINGLIAVQSFYIISGFLMALILTEKYNSYKLFFSNRFLRLYPSYIVILIFTVIFSIFFYLLLDNGLMLKYYFQFFETMTLSTIIVIFFSNLTIFGLDCLMFLGYNPGTGLLFFTPNFYLVAVPAKNFILVPQAWTLGLELSFYLIVPFLNKFKTRTLISIVFVSLFLRFISSYTYCNGLSSDPWQYRFFPFELAFFIAGMLAYRNYRYLKGRNLRSVIELLPIKKIQKYSGILPVILVMFAVLFDFIPLPANIRMVFFYLLLLISLPVLFIQSNINELDRDIGDFSYPVYIGHLLVIQILITLAVNQYLDTTAFGILSILLSIAFASALVRYVEKPLKVIRQKRVKSLVSENVKL